MGLAGPVIGSIGCLVPVGLYALTGNELFQALAFVGFFLNLFNLLPVLPLDGGRAMAALSPGAVARGLRAAHRGHAALPQPDHAARAALRRPRDLAPLEGAQAARGPGVPPRVAPAPAWAVAAVYLGLAALLALGMDATFIERDFGDV